MNEVMYTPTASIRRRLQGINEGELRRVTVRNVPSTELGCAEEVEHGQHNHEERVRPQGGRIHEVRIQERCPYAFLRKGT